MEESISFLTLPEDIKLLIRNELVHRIKYSELKRLRLVSRAFNELFLPVVLDTINLFCARNNYLANDYQLKELVHEADNLRAVKTLKINSTYWLTSSRFLSFALMRRRNQWAAGILMNIGIALYSCFILLPLFPKASAQVVTTKCAQLKTRLRLITSRKLYLPSVRRVQWTIQPDESSLMLAHMARLLTGLPHLTELELTLTDVDPLTSSMFRQLTQLTNLRKLTIEIVQCGETSLLTSSYRLGTKHNSFRDLIASNPNLVHLVINLQNYSQDSEVAIDLATLFSSVAADRPLPLEHFGISWQFTEGWDPEKIMPHFCNLKSIGLCFPNHSKDLSFHNFWEFLARMNVYPPHVSVNHIDQKSLDYLRKHPNLVGLTIPDVCTMSNEIMQILSQHAKTLQYFSMDFVSLPWSPENKRAFLQCTALRQIDQLRSMPYHWISTPDVKPFLGVVAQLDCPVNLMIEQSDEFSWFLHTCYASSDPLLRDLKQRIFLLRRDQRITPFMRRL
ncbi:hypothetical protein AMATHDRAFT_60880, partial [Amanita thiersii Skay4041]